MNRPVVLVGAGRMGSALLKGWLRHSISPLIVVEPRPSADLRKLGRGDKLELLTRPEEVSTRPRACIIALKPQVLAAEAARLNPLARSGAPMISLAAGTSIASLTRAWSRDSRIVRAMPNTPGAIGRGITALYGGKNVGAAERKLAESLLSPLGETFWVEREALIDSVTAVSGSGPAYVFLFVEAMADAARAEGLSRKQAEKLARATITGAGALLDADSRPAAELRRDVTSPGGTTEAALMVLHAHDGLKPLLARAVRAARKRAQQLRD